MASNHLIIKDFLPHKQALELAEYIKTADEWVNVYRVQDHAPLSNFKNNFKGIVARRNFEPNVIEAVCSGTFVYKQKRLSKKNLYSGIVNRLMEDTFRSPDFVEYLRSLSDIKEPIELADNYFASIFDRGDFLSIHEDGDYALAFILNLSQDWRYEYGGCLAVFDEDQVKMVLPEFNSLVVLKLKEEGIKHFVTQVSTFAPDVRIAIGGWYVSTNSS